MKQIILASQSPRRKELLAKMGVQFTAVPSGFEEQLDDARDPAEIARELALGKALAIAEQYPEAIVIGSDTIPVFEGRQLDKPRGEAHARATLIAMAGKANDVITSLAVVCKAQGVEIVDVVVSRIQFKPLDKEALEAYMRSGDWHDKAGGYGIQSGFASQVDFIEGDYDNIIGLPTKRLAEILLSLGVPAHAADVVSPLPSPKAN